MKHLIKPFCLAGFLVASVSANAQTIGDTLDIAQINPDLAKSFNAAGSIVTFYGENYVVDAPQTCSGPQFNQVCQVTISHLMTDPGVTLKINQKIVNGVLVTTFTARPDGKKFMISYNQTAPGTVFNTLNVKRVG